MSSQIIKVDFKTRKRIESVLTEEEQAAEKARTEANTAIINYLNILLNDESKNGQDLRLMMLTTFDKHGECIGMIDMSGEDVNRRHLLKIKRFYDFIKRKLSQSDR